MVKIMQLEPAYSFGAEIQPSDVDALSQAGFRAIVCFRPDGESFGQAPFQVIAASASAYGIHAVHIPVAAGDMNEAAVMSLRSALESLPGPAFGYCKSGMRAASAWALSRRGDVPPDEIVGRLHMHGIRNALIERQVFNEEVPASSPAQTNIETSS